MEAVVTMAAISVSHKLPGCLVACGGIVFFSWFYQRVIILVIPVVRNVNSNSESIVSGLGFIAQG